MQEEKDAAKDLLDRLDEQDPKTVEPADYRKLLAELRGPRGLSDPEYAQRAKQVLRKIYSCISDKLGRV